MSEDKMLKTLAKVFLIMIIGGQSLSIILMFGEEKPSYIVDWKMLLTWLLTSIGISACAYVIGKNSNET